jgi:hypothetical protein
MEQLGHTDPRPALRIYAGVLDGMKLRTADAMGELMQAASADEGRVIALPTRNSAPQRTAVADLIGLRGEPWEPRLATRNRGRQSRRAIGHARCE